MKPVKLRKLKGLSRRRQWRLKLPLKSSRLNSMRSIKKLKRPRKSSNLRDLRELKKRYSSNSAWLFLTLKERTSNKRRLRSRKHLNVSASKDMDRRSFLRLNSSVELSKLYRSVFEQVWPSQVLMRMKKRWKHLSNSKMHIQLTLIVLVMKMYLLMRWTRLTVWT